uniref:Tc1-like transposase DDE domain-containing protein n=1 Tax=Oryzias latipes TaxID=8090 RepID=A0A3P9K2F4_ORYLA
YALPRLHLLAFAVIHYSAGNNPLPAPSMSSDLNPIEHIWDQRKQTLEDRTPPPSDLAELHLALVEEWNAFILWAHISILSAQNSFYVQI